MTVANSTSGNRSPSNRRIPLGSRRQRLVLETPVEISRLLGGASIGFAPLVTLWARLDAGSGREQVAGERLETRAETRITIRWRGGVDATMRFALGNRVFPIIATFDPDGRKRELVCLCQEISR